MTSPRFTVRNEGFVCENCGKDVPAAKKTCRNHCPFCLTSKHVDKLPGDRANECGGRMDLVDYEGDNPGNITLVFECSKCGGLFRNRSTVPGDPCPDAWTVILAARGRR